MNSSYERVNAALRWTSVVRRRWMRVATGPVADIPDVRTPARAHRLLTRAENRFARELGAHDAGSLSPLPDQAVRQLRGRDRARSPRARS
jgi:hypothetical protein